MAGQTVFHTGDEPLFVKHNTVGFVDPARRGIFLYSGMLLCFFLGLLSHSVSRAPWREKAHLVGNAPVLLDNELKGLFQVSPRFGQRAPLCVNARDLFHIGDVPSSALLNHGGELALHGRWLWLC